MTKVVVNSDRLADTFTSLVKIDSVSKNEKAMCETLQKIFKDLGGETVLDEAAEKVGGDCGNLIVRFKGVGPGARAEPFLLSAHMDTVEPGIGIEPVLKDGVFSSKGETILGADDKSAVAIIIETMRALQAAKAPHCPIEIVLTVCEEIGLLGAKNLNFGLISATSGYVLDATDTSGIVTRAPAANHLEFVVRGKDAHAGAHPEDGVNAITAAARALAKLTPGRVDEQTTYNIGKIEGGQATNIVPAEVIIKGEARSQTDADLAQITDWIVTTVTETIAEEARCSIHEGLPAVDVTVSNDFLSLKIPDDHLLVATAKAAAANLGRDMATKTSGGGSDANIFFQHGITAGILGTGMHDMHTVRENVALADMVTAAELLIEIVRIHSENPDVS